jgi:molybdopterin-guanine dinucleotide biosynthesis protein A
VSKVSGLLLTGGRSRRLGVDKAGLVLDGETLARRAARRLAAVCEPVLEVGAGLSGCSPVPEEQPDLGPLAALVAGVAALRSLGETGSVLLVAVDLPNVDVPLLELLRDWPGAPAAVPEAAGRLQPVCARYGPAELAAAASLVTAGVRAMHALLDVIEYDVVGEEAWRAVAPPDAFADVDTPHDARRLGIDLPDRS